MSASCYRSAETHHPQVLKRRPPIYIGQAPSQPPELMLYVFVRHTFDEVQLYIFTHLATLIERPLETIQILL